jgi:hypothetical protein
VKQKQINSSTFKTQTSLWRKKKQVYENKNKKIVTPNKLIRTKTLWWIT